MFFCIDCKYLSRKKYFTRICKYSKLHSQILPLLVRLFSSLSTSNFSPLFLSSSRHFFLSQTVSEFSGKSEGFAECCLVSMTCFIIYIFLILNEKTFLILNSVLYLPNNLSPKYVSKRV